MDFVKYKAIKNLTFSYILNQELDNLSTDQFFAHGLHWCIILGDVDQDTKLVEVESSYYA